MKTSNQIHNKTTPSRKDFLEKIVKQLVHRRKQLHLTQEQVDYLMGNSDRTCSKWECGMRTPTSFNLFCWAEALSSVIKIETISTNAK